MRRSRRNPIGCGMAEDVNSGGNFYKEAYYMAANIALTASSGAGTVGDYIDTPIRVDSDANFELQKIIFQATSPSIKVRIRSSEGNYLTPEATDIQALAGTQFDNVGPGAAVSWFTPYILSRPYRFRKSSDIIIEAADYSGVANTLRICLWGAKIHCGTAPWDSDRYRIGQPTFRSTNRRTIAADGSSSLSINMDSDADVLIKKISAIRTGAALLSIHESGRGYDWGVTPTHIDNIAGSGQFAHKLSAGRMVGANSNMTFNLQDLSSAPNTIEIVIEGVKYHAR
jgi:hypothetical protein